MEESEFEKLKSQILTRHKMRELFDVSNVTLYNWVKDGVIRQHNLGRSVFFLRDEVIEDLKNNGRNLRKEHREMKK